MLESQPRALPLGDRHHDHIETLSISVPCWHKEPFAPARGPNVDACYAAYGTRQKCFYMVGRLGFEPRLLLVKSQMF